MKRVAHLLWRSQGGMRRHVRTIAAHPPCGYETSGIYGPAGLETYFTGLPYTAVSRAGLMTAGRVADVIHAHGVNAGIASLLPGGPPVVLSLHVVVGSSGSTARSPIARRLAKTISSRADALIAVSNAAAIGFERARVIPPAFDPLPAPMRDRREVRSSLGAADDDVVAIVVSRLDADKRLDLFARAVSSSGAVGWIVGPGPEQERLASLVEGTRTTLLGYRDDVADLLGAADVFALPSASESYGIAVAEAIAAGLPVVATRTGAIAELVGDAGMVVDPDDEDAFVAGCKVLCTDPLLRQRYADAASGVVRPDRDALIAALGATYDDVIVRGVG